MVEQIENEILFDDACLLEAALGAESFDLSVETDCDCKN